MELLNNPIWNALSTEHHTLALGDDRARRYPPAIGPLSGIPDQSPANYEALRTLADPGGVVVLFSKEAVTLPSGWSVTRAAHVLQMVALSPNIPSGAAGLASETWQTAPPQSDKPQIRVLTASDAPAMVALAELTEPGPFRLRTIELGTFYGFFHGAQLVAMAGKRMHLPGLVEVSGVCTHPDARGRGYARILMARVMEEIVQAAKTPFLHVLPDNFSAIRAYESLGFTPRQTFHLAVLKNEE